MCNRNLGYDTYRNCNVPHGLFLDIPNRKIKHFAGYYIELSLERHTLRGIIYTFFFFFYCL